MLHMHMHTYSFIRFIPQYTTVHAHSLSLTWRQHAEDRAGVASALGTRLWLVGWLAGVGGLERYMIHDTRYDTGYKVHWKWGATWEPSLPGLDSLGTAELT